MHSNDSCADENDYASKKNKLSPIRSADKTWTRRCPELHQKSAHSNDSNYHEQDIREWIRTIVMKLYRERLRPTVQLTWKEWSWSRTLLKQMRQISETWCDENQPEQANFIRNDRLWKSRTASKLSQMSSKRKAPDRTPKVNFNKRAHSESHKNSHLVSAHSTALVLIIVCVLSSNLRHRDYSSAPGTSLGSLGIGAGASLIIGDSAIEIQEVGENGATDGQRPSETQQTVPSNVILGSTNGDPAEQADSLLAKSQKSVALHNRVAALANRQLPSPVAGTGSHKGDDVTDGDKKSRANHDYDINELKSAGNSEEKDALGKILSPSSGHSPQEKDSEKTIAGKVVDFELTPAGGHNKAKIKKKKKKKMKKEMESSEYKKKWGKKKKSEKKAMEKFQKESMKKKKQEGKKGKKKWGHEEHGQKKKGKFKKKKWGKKVKKGKGVKKGKKGHKHLADKGHKNTGFKTVYHKEEWGKSAKWHDIKREKKWDEKAKKWKKKWKKEKGKKYKGDHMKKFEKKKKEGKKYKKEKKEKVKKFKKEEFKKGKKKKMEEHGKKKEGGAKKEMEEMKKKKKKKKEKKP